MSCVFTRLASWSRALIHAWETLQVELHGQYSLVHLDKLATFARRTGTLHSLVIAVLTPLACVAGIVLVDVLPLRPPSEGLFHQTANYWVRTFFTLAVVSSMVILNVQHASPKLRMNWAHFAVATTLTASATTLVTLILHVVIGFPTPFIIQLSGPAWQAFLVSSIWAMWKNTIRADAEVQQDLQQFNSFNLSQFVMAVVYPVMIYAFGTLNGVQQTIFSISFPVVKLLLKNLASRGVYRREDLAPVFVVLSVDVFHALLLSCAMEKATSRWTYISVMATDVFQSIVAVVEVRTITRQLDRLGGEISIPTSSSRARPVLLGQKPNIVAFASIVLASHPHIRPDPSIALPRHLRDQRLQSPGASRILPLPEPSIRVIPAAWADSSSFQETALLPADAQSTVVHRRALHAEYVRLSLQLLHMIEFYVLIEYTEVMVACIYAIYLSSTFLSPNRDYYLSVKTLTRDQLVETVNHVLQYAAMELLSLVVLCVVLDRLVGLSTLRLLAFTLRKHAVLAQSLLVFWVFTATQLTLEHLGNDYTFSFQWLRHQSEPAS